MQSLCVVQIVVTDWILGKKDLRKSIWLTSVRASVFYSLTVLPLAVSLAA